jgi:hypothetical protein
VEYAPVRVYGDADVPEPLENNAVHVALALEKVAPPEAAGVTDELLVE